MLISKDKTVMDLQKEFSDQFPYLKIEFYHKAHDHFEGSKKADQASSDTLLKDLSSDLSEAEFEITKNLSVDKLETAFEEKFGLHVQVFRQSGKEWLQTSVSDGWTLEEHSKNAKEYADFLASK